MKEIFMRNSQYGKIGGRESLAANMAVLFMNACLLGKISSR